MTTTATRSLPGLAADPFSVTAPHDNLAEMSALGGMLLDGSVAEQVSALVTTEDFYKPAHATIFAAVLDLLASNEAVDPVSVTHFLRAQGTLVQVGGTDYLGKLIDTVPVAENAPHYATVVAERAFARRLVEATTRGQQIALGGGSARENYARIAAELEVAAGGAELASSGLIDGPSLYARYLENLDKPIITGTMFGLADLDALANNRGMLPGEVYLAAAPSGGGKTAFAVNVARHAALHQGKRVLYVSLEMSDQQLLARMIAAEARVDQRLMEAGELSPEDDRKAKRAAALFADAGLHVTDDASATPEKIAAWGKRIKNAGGLDLIIIDYAQLMPPSRGTANASRQEQVADLSRRVKVMARALDVAVLILSQMNRAIDSRSEDSAGMPVRAKKSDIRESSALVNDATMLIFLLNPAAGCPGGHPRAGQLDIQVEKNRHGREGDCVVAFVGRMQLIADLGSEAQHAEWDRRTDARAKKAAERAAAANSRG